MSESVPLPPSGRARARRTGRNAGRSGACASAAVLTFRLIREFDKARLLEKRTYSRTMALLRRAKKIRIGEHGEWLPVRMNPSTGKMLAALGLDIAASATPKRRPGRPPKIGTPD